MPWLFKRCNHPGCEGRVKGFKESYCPTHLKQRQHDYDQTKRDPIAKRFYNSDGWKRLRALKLHESPLCEICGSSAIAVDHRQAIRDGSNPYDKSNLQSLCLSCHSRRHAADGSSWGKKRK